VTTPHGSRFHYLDEDDSECSDEIIGISLSGGGVRAACLGLGALQMAEHLKVFQRARYVSAVSGGSYIATAFVAARAQLGSVDDDAVKPWSPGSGEEAHLRRNLSYLGEDLPDRCLGFVAYLLKTAIHQLQFLAGLLLVSSFLGVAYRAFGVVETEGEVLEASSWPTRAGLAVFVLIAGALLDAWSIPRGGFEPGDRLPARISMRIRTFSYRHRVAQRRGVIALVGVLILPDLVAAGDQLLHFVGAGQGDHWLIATVAAIVFVAVAVAVLRSQKSAAVTRWRRVLLRGARGLFSFLMIAALAVPLLVLVGLQVQARLATNVALFAGAGCWLLFCGFFIHANRTSMHDIYARRLTRAFVVSEPEEGPEKSVLTSARHHRRLDQMSLRCAWSKDVPELLICAAVNLGPGESAQGEGCGSFVFSPRYIGGPAVATRRLAFMADKRCSDVVAASGAAVAPNMGRLTRRTVRAFLALLNLRLGLWVLAPPAEPAAPPSNANQAGPSTGTSPADNAGCLKSGTSTCRAVGTCERLDDATKGRSKIAAKLAQGWTEPGPYWTWKEALGSLSGDDSALFISDGGHWDNTGIIELFRRRCQTIFAVDAAVDEERASNLVRAISLARSELGVEVDMSGADLDRQQPILRLAFRYPDQDATAPRNQLIVMRTFITEEMPTDLVAMSRASGAHGLGSVFPCHVTLNQFLLAQDVDAYITLGRWLCERAIGVADLRPPPTAAVDPAADA